LFGGERVRREKMAFDPKKNARFGKWMEREHFEA